MFDIFSFLCYSIFARRKFKMDETKEIYQIYVDASFEAEIALSTYSVVIMKNKTLLKSYGKKINFDLENSVEAEIYALYQAFLVSLSNLYDKLNSQSFIIYTDCISAYEFLLKPQMKIFKNNQELASQIKKAYQNLKMKLKNKNSSISLSKISRKKNKEAHKKSYSIFKILKKQILSEHRRLIPKPDFIVMEQTEFLKILKIFNSKKSAILGYIMQSCDKSMQAKTTQTKIALELNLSVSFVNKVLKELIQEDILRKTNQGEYLLLLSKNINN